MKKRFVIITVAQTIIIVILVLFAFVQKAEADKQRALAEMMAKEAQEQRMLAEKNAQMAHEQRMIAEKNFMMAHEQIENLRAQLAKR